MNRMEEKKNLLILVFLLFTAVSAHARETRRFLPCFGKDVRGGYACGDGGWHFHSAVPEEARPPLSEDGGLDESFSLFQIFSKKVVRIP